MDLIKRKWERQYDRYIREADELEDEIEKLDLLHSRDKFAELKKKQNVKFYIAALISQFLKDLEKINTN